MRRTERNFDGPIDPDHLRFLAAISTEWADELRRRESQAAEDARNRKLQDFVEAISGPEYPGLTRAPTREDVKRFVDAVTGRDAPSIREAGWNAADHPRAPKGQPGGGQWVSKGGAAGGTRTDSPSSYDNGVGTDGVHPPSESARRANMAATPPVRAAIYSPSHGADAYLTAANKQGGHHWVPQSVIRDLKDNMTKGARDIFLLGTESPDFYNHANDTWNGIKHGKYSDAMRELLRDWIKKNGGRLDADAAQKFLSWIATGKCGDPEFYAKHKALFDLVFKWREGFNLSVVVAARAQELNPNLTGAELKKVAQQFVNGEANGLSRRATSVAKAIIQGGKKGLMATAKRVLPGLTFLSAAMAAKRGWAGQGHTGSGAWGAANEAARDMVYADLVEKLVFPKVLDTVDGMVDVLVPSLNDPTRDRRVYRNGRTYDARTWEPID